jgi:hypothetical protein
MIILRFLIWRKPAAISKSGYGVTKSKLPFPVSEPVFPTYIPTFDQNSVKTILAAKSMYLFVFSVVLRFPDGNNLRQRVLSIL